MKRFLVLWLLMASCLPAGLLCQKACANKNPMLEKLRGAGVKIYTSPRQNQNFCRNEWGSYGTCCEAGSAASAMSHKTQENQKEIEEMIKEIESLPAALSSFQSKAITSMTFAMLIKLRSQRNLDKLLEYLRSHKEEIRSSQLRCMTKLNQVTRASTCNICSGNSQRFFSDSKILMRESECRAILGECETAWRGVVDILDLLDDYTDEVKKSYKEKLNNEHFDSLQAMSDTHKLSALFQRCPKLSTCDTEHVARVCERMISILTPSYAKFIAGTIQNKSQPLIFQILHGIGSLIVHAGKAIVDHAHNIARGVGHLLKGLTPATNAEAQKKPQQKPAQSQGLRKNRDRWALSARDGPQST